LGFLPAVQDRVIMHLSDVVPQAKLYLL